MNPQSEEGTPSLDLEGIDLHRQKLLRQLKVVTKRAFALILEQVRFSRADVFTQKRLDVLHINTMLTYKKLMGVKNESAANLQ